MVAPWRRLLSRRLLLAVAEGFVLIRFFGFIAAFLISATSLSIASARLRSCVRNRCALMTSRPAVVIRLPARRTRRLRTSSGRAGELFTSNRSCTAVATLLTFWPPGPDERMNSSWISLSSMAMAGVTLIMAITEKCSLLSIFFNVLEIKGKCDLITITFPSSGGKSVTKTKKKMTKKAPGSELAGLRGRVAELEKSQAGLRKLQKELRDSEKNWRQLVENIPDVVMTVDRSGTIRAINHTVSGLTVKDVIGKKLYGYIAPEHRGMMREHLEQAFREGIPFSFEILGTGERGPDTAWYETRILPIQSGRNVEAVILISKVVTERRKMEEERRQLADQLMHAQKLESLGVMAGGIAHDFNNLLTGILGSAGLALLDTPGDSPARESIEEIEKAAMRAAELCKQMLAYSGKGKFDVKSIDLSNAVKDMGHFLDASISKKITLRCNLSHDLPPIDADTAQVQQIIMNLVTNAADAIGDGIGIVHVKTGCMDCDEAFLSASAINENLSPGRHAFLKVKDTGCGIDKETEEKLFDPFFTTKFTGRGSGLQPWPASCGATGERCACAARRAAAPPSGCSFRSAQSSP